MSLATNVVATVIAGVFIAASGSKVLALGATKQQPYDRQGRLLCAWPAATGQGLLQPSLTLHSELPDP